MQQSEQNEKEKIYNMIEQTVKNLWIHFEGCQFVTVGAYTQIQKLQSEILMK